MKLLIFTDSRGQETTAGKSFNLFTTRLAARPDVDAEVIAPDNATLPDFFEAVAARSAEKYDGVILFAGPEDWRPRSKDEAKALYREKKKAAFDALFTARSMTAYLGKGLGFDVDGDAAANLYGHQMARTKLVPALKDIPNLVFVDATPASEYEAGSVLAKYAEILREELGEERFVSLSDATLETDPLTDDCGLTEAGSDALYDGVVEALMDNLVTIVSDPAPKSSSRKDLPLISVIVPVYNVKDYLRECLDSLVAQDDHNFEVVIIDDGSTDESPEIIAEYCSTHDNFRSHRQVNAGLGGARNSGFEIAEGDFITYLDSDDYVTIDYVSALRAAQAEGDHDIVSADFQRVNDAGDLIKPGVIQTHIVPDDLQLMAGYQRLLGAFTPSVAWGRLFRRTLISDHLLRFPEKLPHEDLFFTYKAFMFARSTARIARPLVSWRIREGSLSRSIGEAHVEAAMQLWQQTEAFVRMNDHDDLDPALAARRTLIFLRDIWNRSQRGDNPIAKARYADMFTRKVGDLEALIDMFEKSPLSGTLDTAPLHGVVEALQIAQLERLAPCEPFNTIPTPDITWPHANVNLQVYASKEYEGDVEPDTDKMRAYHNKYKGQRCFIVGNGPSLNKHDLALLEDEYTFAVNSIFYKTEESGFVPTFFVVEDSKVMEENLERIAEYDAPHRFFPTKYRAMVGERPNTTYYQTNWGFYQKSSANYCHPRFSVDASREVFAGQTVTYANLQLAFFMGFTEVYLIGMDFDYVIPKEHIREGNHILSTTDDPNHFHKDYFGVGKTWKDPKLERVAMSYRQAKVSFEAAGRRVYNATAGGKLEIFPRVNFEELLRDPGTGEKRVTRVSPRPLTLGEGHEIQPPPPLLPVEASRQSQVSPTATGASQARAELPVAPRPAEPEQPDPTSPRSSKLAKLFRDPRGYFGDAKIGVLRPLKHLFSPAQFSKREDEQYAAENEGREGLLSFLPISRGKTYKLNTINREARKSLEASLRKSIQDHQSEISALKHEMSAIRSEARNGLHDIRKHLSGSVSKTAALEARLNKSASSIAALDGRSQDVDKMLSGLEKHFVNELVEMRGQFDLAMRNGESSFKESLDDVSERLTTDLAVVQVSVDRVRSELETNIGKITGENIPAIAGQIARLESGQADVNQGLSELAGLHANSKEGISQLSATTSQLAELQAHAKEEVSALSATTSQMKEQIDNLAEDVEAEKEKAAEFVAGSSHDKRFTVGLNGRSWRVHDRYLSAEEISYFQKNWMRPLGLFLSNKQLGYMAHRIALAEDRCEGRMATTIQAAMVRALALLSLQSKSVELLEIGTLFGIGAGTLHEVGTRAGREMNLTLLDPLDGYYGQKLNDEATGVPITRSTLEHNMKMMGVPEKDYRVIQQLSTEDAALEAAGDRQYDYLLIDGDHSLEGVAADFDLYGGMVKPGGVVVFDDYGTKDWPAIKTYVDENVRDLDDWLWIGGEFRTAILRKRRSSGAAKGKG